MHRGEGIVCGTTTTGTGTLTLAATPVPPGGVDFDVWARACGYGDSAAFMVEYTIIEYTDTAFTTSVQMESGVGTLTLGASTGIANCTLARTTKEHTATGLNTPPAAPDVTSPAGINIGTAANTLVMTTPRPRSALGALPYTSAGSTTFSRDGAGIMNLTTTNVGANLAPSNQMIYYIPLVVPCRTTVSRARVRVTGAYTGQNNNVYAALYLMANTGHPGKLLVDFGVLGTANASFGNNNTIIGSAILATEMMLDPGFYIAAIHAIWTAGGTGTPGLSGTSSAIGLFSNQMFGTVNFTTVNMLTLASNASTTFADPAAAPSAAISNSATYLIAFGN
jgi:hypothetical protein